MAQLYSYCVCPCLQFSHTTSGRARTTEISAPSLLTVRTTSMDTAVTAGPAFMGMGYSVWQRVRLYFETIAETLGHCHYNFQRNREIGDTVDLVAWNMWWWQFQFIFCETWTLTKLFNVDFPIYKFSYFVKLQLSSGGGHASLTNLKIKI